jgi:hypothetical protein
MDGSFRFIFKSLRGRISRANDRFAVVNALPTFQLRLGPMKRSQADQTTAKNLEERFDRGEEVLEYFEVTKARVINPRLKGSVVKTKFASARIDRHHPRPRHRDAQAQRAPPLASALAVPRFQSQRRTSRFNLR